MDVVIFNWYYVLWLLTASLHMVDANQWLGNASGFIRPFLAASHHSFTQFQPQLPFQTFPSCTWFSHQFFFFSFFGEGESLTTSNTSLRQGLQFLGINSFEVSFLFLDGIISELVLSIQPWIKRGHYWVASDNKHVVVHL